MGIPKQWSDSPEPSGPKKGPALRRPSSPEAPKETRSLVWIVTWIGAVSAMLILGLTVGGLILLNSPAFHRYLRATLEKQTSEALGVQVELRDFALHLQWLGVDLYGITIHGASPYPNPPLLQVEHVRAGIGITSVLQKKWYFRTI